MKTKIVEIDPNHIDDEKMQEAAALIAAGELVAFPTETVYGLGADALHPEASQKIYAAKGRPSDNPLIVHISKFEELISIAKTVPEQARKLSDAFWPGPLTMIVWKNEKVPYETTGGMDTVAIRMPNHPVALRLIEQSGCLIAAPSANTSGKPSPTEAPHVALDLDGKIPMILDGGPVGIGVYDYRFDGRGADDFASRIYYQRDAGKSSGRRSSDRSRNHCGRLCEKAKGTGNEVQALCAESRSCSG